MMMQLRQQNRLYDSGFYYALMSRGATPWSYVWGFLPVTAAWYLAFGMIVWAGLATISVSMPMFWLPVILYAITEPIFHQFWMEVTVRRGRCTGMVSVLSLFAIYLLAYLLGVALIP
jgi:hypothetical protein